MIPVTSGIAAFLVYLIVFPVLAGISGGEPDYVRCLSGAVANGLGCGIGAWLSFR